MFISIEGLDGSGKTTQAKLLSDWLASQGYRRHGYRCKLEHFFTI